MRNINKLLNFLILGLVVVFAAGFFYLSQKKNSKTPFSFFQEAPPSTEHVDKVVNKYLKEAAFGSEKEDMKVQHALIDFQYKMKELENQKRREAEKSHAQIPLEKQLWKDESLGVRPNTNETTSTEAPMTAKEKEAYKREYIENARRDGYEIELSDDLEVIKVKPISNASTNEPSVSARAEKPTVIRKPSKESDVVEHVPSD